MSDLEERLGVWGHFSKVDAGHHPAHKYWNVFGQQPMRLRQNMLVEINPPGSGKNLNRQGVLARDDHGHRWLLHQGRLHPRGIRIHRGYVRCRRDGAAHQSPLRRGPKLHPVTVLPISISPPTKSRTMLQHSWTSRARVRVHYQLGDAARQMLERINAAEALSSPERQGAYTLPPMPARMAERRHADIWHALVSELDALGIQHANSRFGRYGPDLFAQTLQDTLLFEIKADATASDIQRALGQLQLYEHLGGQVCRKITALPEAPGQTIARALGSASSCYSSSGEDAPFVRLDQPALLEVDREGTQQS